MDKFSNLPKDIAESILTLIPLKDAVRTSVLSKEWRYKWTTIPTLVFTKECCPTSCKGRKEIRAKLTTIINNVLSLHTGSIIQVYKVTEPCPCLHVESWLHRVCQSSVKELSILTEGDKGDHTWSSPLYMCPTLTLLDLSFCSLKPPPPFFSSLNNLKTLDLMYVYLSEDGFEGILRGCPVLENLSVLSVDPIKRLRINSPRLQSLKVSGTLDRIMFRDTHPELLAVSIWFDMEPIVGAESYMAEFLTKIPNVKTLAIEGHFLMYLSCGLIPERLPTPCYDLHNLTLKADLRDEKLILGALCILRSTPSLTRLEITDVRGTMDELENMDWRCGSCTLDKLTTLVVHQSEPKELHFITYLLQNLTALEKVTVYVLETDFAQQKIPNYKPYTQALIDVVPEVFPEFDLEILL